VTFPSDHLLLQFVASYWALTSPRQAQVGFCQPLTPLRVWSKVRCLPSVLPKCVPEFRALSSRSIILFVPPPLVSDDNLCQNMVSISSLLRGFLEEIPFPLSVPTPRDVVHLPFLTQICLASHVLIAFRCRSNLSGFESPSCHPPSVCITQIRQSLYQPVRRGQPASLLKSWRLLTELVFDTLRPLFIIPDSTSFPQFLVLFFMASVNVSDPPFEMLTSSRAYPPRTLSLSTFVLFGRPKHFRPFRPPLGVAHDVRIRPYFYCLPITRIFPLPPVFSPASPPCSALDESASYDSPPLPLR